MFTVKHAADLAGISADTLRAWERRYGVVSPTRTAAGYRLYDADQVRTLTAMRELVEAGWSARQAADEVTRRRPEPVSPPGSGPTPASDRPAFTPDVPDLTPNRPVHAADPPTPATEWELLSDQLLDAAARMDAERLADVLDAGFGRNSFEVVVDSWLMPAVVRIGWAWANGEISEASEHLASHAIARRIAAVFEASARIATGPRVVIGLPAGCLHELGVFSFACAARRVGLNVLYVGTNLPSSSWVEAVRRHDAVAAVLAVPDEASVAAASETVAALVAARPRLVVLAGGAEQTRVPAQPLGHTIGPAARSLAELLRTGEVARKGQDDADS